MQKNFWDNIAQTYRNSVLTDPNHDFAYERQVNSLSILSLCDNHGGNALDLGCGDGRFTLELTSRYKKTYGVDYSINMLKLARKRCPGVHFIQHDLEQSFPLFNVKFDLIVCKLFLMYIKNIDLVAGESYKLLNSGGCLVVSVTHPLKWIVEHQKGNVENKNYLGYLSETAVQGEMAHVKDLRVVFLNRTLETYVNSFTKHGFRLEAVLETGVPDSFVIKFPSYLPFQKKPYRLNLKFVK